MLFNKFVVLAFIIVSIECFAKPIDTNQSDTKSLSEITLQMKRIDEKASKAESKTEEMLATLKKLIEQKKIKYKSFLHKEIK